MTAVEAIPLTEAVYCEDCHCVTHTTINGRCHNCNSTAIEWLRKWLDRTQESPA